MRTLLRKSLLRHPTTFVVVILALAMLGAK